MLNLEKIEQLAEIVAMNLITIDRNTEKIISDVVVTDNSDPKSVALKNKIDKLAAAIQSTENARVRQLVELQKLLFEFFHDDRAIRAYFDALIKHETLLAYGSDNHKTHLNILKNTLKNALEEK